MTTAPAQPESATGGGPRRGPAGALIDFFHPARLPPMSRHAFRRELTGAFCFPFVLVMFEGSVLSVLVRIAFEGAVAKNVLNPVTGFIAVIPPLANLSSFVWVRLSHGRDKIRFVTTLQLVMVLCAAVIAFVPVSERGLFLVAAAALLGRSCWAGVATLRSTIWKLNYPDGARAQITGKFAMVQVLLAGTLAAALGGVMELNPDAFRVLVPVGCAMALVGRRQWTKIRLRGARALVRGEAGANGSEGPSFNPVRMVSILTRDHRYAAYMLCQFLLGMGNIASVAVLAILLREVFDVGYFFGMLVSTTVPFLVMPFVIPMWARFLDGTHIVRFRAVHSWVFTGAQVFLLGAIVLDWPWLLLVFALLKGIAFGGGVLGWTLGHLDFATKDQSSQYMGVHVTLTGVRGLLAGFLAAPAYVWLSDLFAHDGAPDNRIGAAVAVAICFAMTLAGTIGFMMMRSHFQRRGLFHRETKPEPVPLAQVER